MPLKGRHLDLSFTQGRVEMSLNEIERAEQEPVVDVDGDNLCEIRKSANEMIFILQCILGDERKRRTRDETAQLEVLERHAFWILSKTN